MKDNINLFPKGHISLDRRKVVGEGGDLSYKLGREARAPRPPALPLWD